MSFLEVSLSSFRNLKDGDIKLDAPVVILVGDNGQGKTNFLEALYYLSFGSSFRGQVDAEAAKRGASGFALSGRCSIEGQDPALPAESIRVSWEGGAKTIRRNEKPLRDRKELLGVNPCIVFCHEDFSFGDGEPERRRFFFDQTASLVSFSYVDALREFKHVLKQRNAALRGQRHDLLASLDELFVGAGLRIMSERRALQIRLGTGFSQRFEAVAGLGRQVNIAYRPSWPEETGLDELLSRLQRKRPEELSMGTSLSGPHRDRWSFMSSEGDFGATASTGQLRLLSLTLRVIQAEYYQEETGRAPVLLLDDVLLELDRGKRTRFLSILPPSGQSVFTFLPGEDREDYQGRTTLVYEVKDGRLAN